MRVKEVITKDHVLIFRQILLSSSKRNVWRTVRRICIFMPGLKGFRSRSNGFNIIQHCLMQLSLRAAHLACSSREFLGTFPRPILLALRANNTLSEPSRRLNAALMYECFIAIKLCSKPFNVIQNHSILFNGVARRDKQAWSIQRC